jgi:asparagine synthase (glutamine-hydrolysing)
MSGIVGIYHRGGCPVSVRDLEQMLHTLAHRGPDGTRHWQGNGIALGHCMLWTTPESLKEELPYHDRDADLVITADARLDNREALFKTLNLDAANTSEMSDSELILTAYQRWGPECLQHLLGDFAFAIWDNRQQRLFCARDHFGIRPFYYFCTDEWFIFASELKALLTLPYIPRQLNEVRIADYLLDSMMLQDKVLTVYRDILRLPPAHWVYVCAPTQPFKPYQYWALDPTAQLPETTDEAYAETFREIFFEAVRCRLRSAFPVGSHLSGGLDSSTVTCVAHQILKESPSSMDISPLHTFSNVFDEVSNCDERTFFQHVLNQGTYVAHFVAADQVGPITEWQDFFRYTDEPCLGPSHFYIHGLNRATQGAGVRICLDGFDGDTVVSHGATYFTELARQGDWKTFIKEAQAVSEHFPVSLTSLVHSYVFPYLSDLAQRHQWLAFHQCVKGLSQAFLLSRRQLWVQYGIKPLLPQWLIALVRFFKYGQVQPSPEKGGAAGPMNPDFLKRTAIKALCQRQPFPPRPVHNVREEQYRDLNSGAFTHVLEIFDQTAAAFSMESRHPFLDKRLVEFCLALPPHQKLKQGWSRYIMRQAMAGVLPEPIRWRGGKTSMEENFDRGFLNRDRAIVENALSQQNYPAKEYLNLNFLQQSYQKVLADPEIAKTQSALMMALWKGTALSLWLHSQRPKGSLELEELGALLGDNPKDKDL